MKYQLKSSAKLEINEASIGQCWTLYQAICNSLKKDGLSLPDFENMSFAEIIRNNPVAILNLLSSDEILESVLECAKQCLYKGQKITLELFDSNKGDFFSVLQMIALENLRPFFPDYHTAFQGLMDYLLA